MGTNVGAKSAELAMVHGSEAVKDGLVLQLLVGLTQEMGRHKGEYMVEVRADNNLWGMKEGWYSVVEILRWVTRNMVHN